MSVVSTAHGPPIDSGPAGRRWPLVAVDRNSLDRLDPDAVAAADVILDPVATPAIATIGSPRRATTIVDGRSVMLIDVRSTGALDDDLRLADLAATVLGLPDPPEVVLLSDDPLTARAAVDLLEALRCHRTNPDHLPPAERRAPQ